jgi:DNA-binding SARP family transcriptional activator/predicted ATPase
VASLLWPSSSDSQARTNLRQLLFHLKRALPTDGNLLETDHFAVQWRRDESRAVDVIEFQKAIEEAVKARRLQSREQEIQALRAAEQLYVDDLLPSLYDEWVAPLREGYRRQFADVLRRLAELFEEQESYIEAIRLADRLVELDPLSEPNYQTLIRLHEANHDRAGALRTYHQCLRVLRREMGVTPGAATQELFDRILNAEPSGGNAGLASPPSRGGARSSRLQKVGVLVGREAEWQELASVWQTAVDDGPQTVVISGEPGIGKTRLADEMYQSCVQGGYSVARGRCYSGRGQVPYAAVADLVRADVVRAGWKELASWQLTELARLVPEIGSPMPDAERLQPVPAPTNSESWRRLHLYQSLIAAFGTVRKPALMYLDDMQWCDPDSFEWLNAWLGSAESAGSLLLLTVRSEETGREHPFTQFLAELRRSGRVLEIPLKPLGDEETADLAQLISSEPLERGQVEEILRDTRGNPLFVVESVRAGLSSTRVHAVISARLAQLSPLSYELAGLASVVGRPFSMELLEKASDWDESSVTRALDDLWHRRIIEGRGTTEYDFTHDRLREVAYSELGLVRQRHWHRRVARAFAEVHESHLEGWDGQIAFHLEQAGAAEEAIKHYRRAADFARKRYADKEAAYLLKRARALLAGFPESERRLEEELDLLTPLGLALLTTEGYSAAEVGETYALALDLARRLDGRNIFAILSGMWVFETVRGNLNRAREFGLEFLRLAEQDRTPARMQAGHFVLGCSLFHLGQLEASLKHMTASIQSDGRASDSDLALFAGPDVGVFTLAYLAHLAWHRGDEELADAYACESIASAQRIRHPFSQAIALNYAAILEVFRGAGGAALQRANEATELCAKNGFTYYLAMANILGGWAEAAEGEVSRGGDRLREGLDRMRDLGAELRMPFYLSLLAETNGRAGRSGEALASISTGLAFAGKNEEEWATSELYRIQGSLLAAEGRPEAAKASFSRGIEAARTFGSPAFERKVSAAETERS